MHLVSPNGGRSTRGVQPMEKNTHTHSDIYTHTMRDDGSLNKCNPQELVVGRDAHMGLQKELLISPAAGEISAEFAILKCRGREGDREGGRECAMHAVL